MSLENHVATFKILVLGESNVGKTSFIRRFTDEKFQQSYISTIGIDAFSKIIDVGEEKIKLQIWDTAGQERFRTLTNAYYRGAMGILLMYDVTCDYTFNCISGWMESISQHATANVVRILIGNKADKPKYEREVSTELGERKAIEFNCQFFETSAKEGTNVNKAFLTLAETINENRLNKQTASSNIGTITLNSKSKSSNCC